MTNTITENTIAAAQASAWDVLAETDQQPARTAFTRYVAECNSYDPMTAFAAAWAACLEWQRVCGASEPAATDAVGYTSPQGS